jgi:hypothetical protein
MTQNTESPDTPGDSMVADGMTVEEICRDLSDLTPEDVS